MQRFEGRVALVTAGAQGIGAAVARRIAAEGGKVVVTDLQEDKVNELAAELDGLGLRVDVTQRADVDAAVAATIERFGRLDVLVNNAGGCIVTSVPEDTTDEEWHRQLDLTLVGAARCIQAALPHLVQARGNVVTISSVNAIGAFGNIEYAAAKAGQLAMTTNYAARYGGLGVRFNVVAPGTIRTPNWDNQLDTLEKFKKMYPLGRVGEPEDVAAAVAFLASDDASWITGHTLPVEGGVLTGPGLLDLTPSGPFRKEY
ncbi:SDR family oxidoreductase [Kribbella sandramycini]|uniref:NAD(P)-dependent dehydrogenase (Short-subunit alcohol dehydrogenase family) n=1 Tax=Kribbella sandramycini TaxID=60450 RepID=A0A7Y4L5P0_9ACTN|nr:SDR family NAD(P)-dependent oxidoreductase [Kribbella sandramycini]MBB6567128.1 NAD(P)-dependent dehydrogenase (short-subunit alcohol dehydrogenase family) [Kribbella sandramycini]NOL44845.1 SDR family oxidoreductase [Kribbella sandramycini]